MKIVILGAGSASFGSTMIRDLVVTPEMTGRGVRVTLVDTDPEALTRSLRFSKFLAARAGSDIAFDTNPDRRTALPGADYVVTSVARRRMELWEQDFRIPLTYGFKHCLGENGGPGAVFHTMRSLHLMVPIARDVEALAPQATLLNFTNPEMKVLHAISTLTKAKAAGLCHGIGGAIHSLAKVLGIPKEQLKVVSAGMNHFYCVLQAIDLATGKDRLEEAKAKVLAAPDQFPRLFVKMLEVFDVFTFPSDDHIGEYVSFAAEFLGTHWHYGQECRKVTLNPPAPGPAPHKHWLDRMVDGDEPVPDWFMKPSEELAVPIFCDIDRDRHAFREAVNVLNTGRFIENLPADCVIEVPATVDARGIHPERVGALPEPFAAMIRPQATICSLLTEAYRTGSRKLLLQALVLDPVVDSITAARKLLDEMLKLQADFLPEFA